MHPKYSHFLSCTVLCMGMASVLFFMDKASGGRTVFNGYVAWALAPYIVAVVAALLPQGPFGALGVLLGCVFLVVVSAWGYYDAFFVHPDPQNGLVFVFFPPVQLAFSIVLLVCAGTATAVSAPRNNAGVH